MILGTKFTKCDVHLTLK